jgi:hypothetical protein
MPISKSLLLNQQQMGCGGCGGKTFKVYTPDKTALIVMECDHCKSTSLIEPQPAQLRIEWGDGEGRIAVI